MATARYKTGGPRPAPAPRPNSNQPRNVNENENLSLQGLIERNGTPRSIFHLQAGRAYYWIFPGQEPIRFIRGGADDSETEDEIRQAGIRVGNNVVYPGEGAFYEYQAAQGGRRRSRKMRKGRKGRKMRKSTQKRRM